MLLCVHSVHSRKDSTLSVMKIHLPEELYDTFTTARIICGLHRNRIRIRIEIRMYNLYYYNECIIYITIWIKFHKLEFCIFINEWLSALSTYHGCHAGIFGIYLSKTKHVPKEDSQPFLSLCFELDQTWARVHNRHINFTRMYAKLSSFKLWKMATPYTFIFIYNFKSYNNICVKRCPIKMNGENIIYFLMSIIFIFIFSFDRSSYKSYCNHINSAAALKVMMRLQTEEQSICACGEESSVYSTMYMFWRRRRFRKRSGNIFTALCIRCRKLLVKQNSEWMLYKSWQTKRIHPSKPCYL